MSMSASPRPDDPLALFQRWYDDAVRAGLNEPEAMTLATATPDGRPSARIVLYRGMSGGGLRFFTNFEGRKGGELAANPRAAVVFYWPPDRQVRMEGWIEELEAAECDAYFAARPRGHQLAAWASPQSRPIGNEELLARYAELEARHAGAPVPRPPFWGGFRLLPDRIELWTRRENRLHERMVYTLADGAWVAQQIGP